MTRVAALCLAALAGCAGERLRVQVGAVERSIQAARARGAESCAPVQLAMAEAHTEFAEVELDQGDYYSARAELSVAEANAEQALRLTPTSRCVQRAEPRGGGDRDDDGVPDERDECQAQPEDQDGAQDQDGCPDTDNDADGMVDAIDRCPDAPEDKDGFDDDDGCPELDNDGDQLADRIDQCPDKPEDADGFDDDDGCPDCDDDGDRVPECPQQRDRCPGKPGRPPDGCPFKGVMVSGRRIQLGEPVRFGARQVIRPASHAMLIEVARVMEESPDLRVRVEAHTDNKGPARRNLAVTRARAAAVKRFLVGRGIAESRILSEGYGETRPLAENTTPAGRAQNRRVELVIIGR
ncbi:MAG TPA: OmpA family protein [Kofleriaceae bacterium]|nr:OmpA family protein [Kofleriaceae bacterium]